MCVQKITNRRKSHKLRQITDVTPSNSSSLTLVTTATTPAVLLPEEEEEWQDPRCPWLHECTESTCASACCYEYESDGFNAPLLFDRWTAVVRQGQQCQTVAPRVQARCEHYEPNNVQARNTLFRDTVHKSLPAYDKLRSDSTGRLELQHRTSRACRLLGFAFVAVQPLQGLLQELVHLSLLPHVAPHLAALEEELPAYRELAIAALTDSDVPNPPPDALWEFWRRHALSLPCWYEAAAEVALIMTSSASVERLFSLYTSLFTDEQANALEDYRETALMLRFNLRQREKEQ